MKMSSDNSSDADKIKKAIKSRPHVVVLGAGASRATCPSGDKNGKALPLMQDFTQGLELESLLNEWNIDPNQNFEDIFSDLFEKGEQQKLDQIITRINDYFKQLEIPDKPTIYDHLVLSLREQDLIATFNWDPLLLQAYCRNGVPDFKLPKLAFLHGNVSAGFCEKDGRAGLLGRDCSRCQEPFQQTPLLYPIKTKNYSSNPFITQEWKHLEWGFENAIMITIFGYSKPKTDVEAISAMKKAWGEVKKRQYEQTYFITRNKNEEEISEHWKEFIHTHHFSAYNSFYDSFIAKHPRRTQEAYFHQYLGVEFIEQKPIPKDYDFQELWEWYEQFRDGEDDSDILKTFDDVL